MWQPVFFHGDNKWIEKIAGGWSLSGIFNIHSGFPWTPVVNFSGSLYCGSCSYSSLPAVYLGGAGNNTSNDAFKTVVNSNFPNGGTAYFATPNFTAFSGTASGNALPQVGVQRNSFNGPGYKDLDATLVKAFGLPSNRVLGERAMRITSTLRTFTPGSSAASRNRVLPSIPTEANNTTASAISPTTKPT